MKNFNKTSITIISALAFILVSCSGDSDPVEPVPADVNPPTTYSWLDDNGEETVSFGGQTTRLQQAAIICSKMGSSDATFSEIDEMFNLGEGFSDLELNYSNSGKKVSNKTGGYSANSTEILAMFNSWITEFTSDVIPAMVAGIVAEPGVPGVLPDGPDMRELNAKGMELDQLFTKGLIGALCGDQIIYGYLSEIKIGDDIDTDRIIPARFLKCVNFDNLGQSVFEDDRKNLKGKHPFDLESNKGSSILIVNSNFGCGSSREHAPQALLRWGIRAIIGESFAEIFYCNCIAIGIPCFTLPKKLVKNIQENKNINNSLCEINIKESTFKSTFFNFDLEIKISSKNMFLSGEWDATSTLLANKKLIEKKINDLPYTKFNQSNELFETI